MERKTVVKMYKAGQTFLATSIDNSTAAQNEPTPQSASSLPRRDHPPHPTVLEHVSSMPSSSSSCTSAAARDAVTDPVPLGSEAVPSPGELNRPTDTIDVIRSDGHVEAGLHLHRNLLWK